MAACRCGWATKPNQEAVLAIEITCTDFAWALANATFSHFDSTVHTSYADEWTISITDVTPLATEIRHLVRAGDLDAATGLLPAERPYPNE